MAIPVPALPVVGGSNNTWGADLNAYLGQLSDSAFGSNGGAFDENATVTFTANTPASGISRMVQFKMTTEYDRPWISWVDENARHRVAMGYHSRDLSSGNYHNAFEIKISTDPAAVDPADMRTRFSLSTNTEVGTASFAATETVQIDRSIYSADTAIGYLIRTPDSTGISRPLGGWMASLDPNDNTMMLIDARVASANNTATVKVFRQTNSSVAGGVHFILKRGDGTDTNAFDFDMRGWATISNATATPSINPTLGGVLYVQNGALMYRGSSGTVSTIAAA